MLKIGLTGGIGSGKTTIAKIFETLNIPIYYSDYWAKYLTNNDEQIKQSLINKYGKHLYKNNKLNKNVLADIIFNNKSELEYVNSLIHPVVAEHFKNWAENQKSDYIIKEAAILFESGAYKQVDKIITVVSNIKTRIKRIKERDNIDEELILKKIKSQMPDNEKIDKSDFIIYNNENDFLIPQVLNIHNKLKLR